MSKKSEREARERKEQTEQEKLLRFSTTLKGYLNDFAQYYRQDPPGEESILLYQMGLRHLNEEELKAAFQESIQKCKFFPSVAEMLECLREWQDRQPTPGTAVSYESPKETANDRAIWNNLLSEFWDEHKAKDSEPMPGMRWNFDADKEDEAKYGKGRKESGWRSREESWRIEQEQNARIKAQKPWHAPISFRQPGED